MQLLLILELLLEMPRRTRVRSWQRTSFVDERPGRPFLKPTNSVATYPSGDNAFRCDWLVERGGFELPRPFRIGGAEFNPSLARYPTPNKSISAGENMFALDSALLRSSPVPFVRYAGARKFGDNQTSDEDFEFESPPLARLFGRNVVLIPTRAFARAARIEWFTVLV